MALMSDTLRDALIEQWGHEILNSHIYAYIAAFFKNQGLDNLGAKFMGQVEEERGHAQIIMDLLTDLNADFFVPEIPMVQIPFTIVTDVADAFLEREIATTANLKSLRDLGMEEGCVVVEERMRQMIILQQNEYEEATTFKDRAYIIGSDMRALLLWDASLGD